MKKKLLLMCAVLLLGIIERGSSLMSKSLLEESELSSEMSKSICKVKEVVMVNNKGTKHLKVNNPDNNGGIFIDLEESFLYLVGGETHKLKKIGQNRYKDLENGTIIIRGDDKRSIQLTTTRGDLVLNMAYGCNPTTESEEGQVTIW